MPSKNEGRSKNRLRVHPGGHAVTRYQICFQVDRETYRNFLSLPKKYKSAVFKVLRSLVIDYVVKLEAEYVFESKSVDEG